MAYKNIYDWHDSMRKYLEKEIEKDRRETISGWMDRVDGDEQHRFFTGRLNSGGKPEGQKRQSKIEPDLKNIWGTPEHANSAADGLRKKWGYGFKFNRHDWGVPKNPANGGAWERQSKIEPDLRNIWGTPGQTYTSCGQSKKRDPNDITDLCKVEIIK